MTAVMDVDGWQHPIGHFNQRDVLLMTESDGDTPHLISSAVRVMAGCLHYFTERSVSQIR